MLTLQFLSSIVSNKFVSDEILEYCGLLTQRKNKRGYLNPKNLESLKSYQANFLKVKFSIFFYFSDIPSQILTVDPPFRMNNYFILGKLIYEFSC